MCADFAAHGRPGLSNRECHWIAPVTRCSAAWLRPAISYSPYRTRPEGQGQDSQGQKKTNEFKEKPTSKRGREEVTVAGVCWWGRQHSAILSHLSWLTTGRKASCILQIDRITKTAATTPKSPGQISVLAGETAKETKKGPTKKRPQDLSWTSKSHRVVERCTLKLVSCQPPSKHLVLCIFRRHGACFHRFFGPSLRKFRLTTTSRVARERQSFALGPSLSGDADE